jgi:hypothetical protein
LEIKHWKSDIKKLMSAPAVDYGLLLALFIPLFAIIPLMTHAGLPNTADGPAHLMRQVELNQAWQQGNFYPRWGTDLALGHGMPIFSYAPPLLYQVTQLLHLTGLPLDAAMKGVVILGFLLYSAGMFLFTRRIFGTGPALAAAAVYVYAPYRLREAFIQGNYGQFSGLAFYPLIFWAFHGLITTQKRRYLPAAALSLAGLLFSHNISAMLFLPIFGVYLLFLLIQNHKNSSRSLWRVVTAGLLGLGLSAIFWLPAFGEKGEIKLEGITRGFFDFRHNFISLAEFLSAPIRLDLTAINPEFPLSLGLPQLIAAGMGILSLIYWLRRKPTSTTRAAAHTLFFTVFLALYAFLALPWSRLMWEAVPLLELAEFPWRMLGPAVFCAAFLTAPAFAALIRPKFQWPTLTIFLLMVIGLNLPYLYPSQFILWGTPTPADAFAYEVTSGAIGTTSTGEFLPRHAQQHPQPETLRPDYETGRPPQKLDPATLPAGATVNIISHQAEADILRINTPQKFTATLRTLYWPGWRVYLDGQPSPIAITAKTGLIQVDVPPGEHTLTLQLESTPLRSVGLWLTLASALTLIIIVAYPRRTIHEPETPLCLAAETVAKNHKLKPLPRGTFLIIAALLLTAWLLTRPLAPRLALHSDPDRPQPADEIVQVDFSDQMRLLGVDNLPPEITIPAELTAVLYWRALQEIETNYAVFLHLDAPNGETMATTDERHPENIPTRNWPPGLYLRNPLRLDLPNDLPPIRYTLNAGLYNPETGQRLAMTGSNKTVYSLGHIWLTGPRPKLNTTPLVRFGADIQLWQADYDATAQNLTLYWQADVPVTENYSIFIHLLDSSGNVLAQADGVPYDGLYPPTHWRPQQIITDVRPLPPAPTNTIANIAIGIYNLDTGERLSVIDVQGDNLPGNSFVLRISE